MSKPVQIEDGEWYYKGCFIQKQTHPSLMKYHIFKDTKSQATISFCGAFLQAIAICNKYEVKNPIHTAEDFLN